MKNEFGDLKYTLESGRLRRNSSAVIFGGNGILMFGMSAGRLDKIVFLKVLFGMLINREDLKEKIKLILFFLRKLLKKSFARFYSFFHGVSTSVANLWLTID